MAQRPLVKYFKETTTYKDCGFQTIGELIAECTDWREDNKFIYINFGDARDYSVVRRDRSAIIAEHRKFLEVTQFLFRNNAEFEYLTGKMCIQIYKNYDRHVRVTAEHVPDYFWKKVKLTIEGYKMEKVVVTEEITDPTK